MSAGVKSAPVLLLAAAVLSWNGGQSVLGVVGGLIFSAVGDCCLVWPDLFLPGKSLHKSLSHLWLSDRQWKRLSVHGAIIPGSRVSVEKQHDRLDCITRSKCTKSI